MSKPNVDAAVRTYSDAYRHFARLVAKGVHGDKLNCAHCDLWWARVQLYLSLGFVLDRTTGFWIT